MMNQKGPNDVEGNKSDLSERNGGGRLWAGRGDE